MVRRMYSKIWGIMYFNMNFGLMSLVIRGFEQDFAIKPTLGFQPARFHAECRGARFI